MNSSFFKFISPMVFLPFFLLFFVVFFFSPFLTSEGDFPIFVSNHNGFIWPVPNANTITSYFGYREAPTSGSSTYHSGIDIAANVGSPIVAVISGKIIDTGFRGAGGYTITLQNDIYTISYCHVSPLFLVSIGDVVSQGDRIGSVGPKNVYGVPNNPYKDSNGNPTNGTTTGPHLHFTLKINNQAVNPLDYLSF